MSMTAIVRRLIALSLLILFSAAAGIAKASEVKVMISGGLATPYKELVPQFERATGNTVITAYGPSMGTTENAIPVRLARGEAADVLIMVGDALGEMIEQGKAVRTSRVDLVRSPIGIAVRAGTSKPDIRTPDALKEALLNAKSVAYSDSASGVYVGTELFKRLRSQVLLRAAMPNWAFSKSVNFCRLQEPTLSGRFRRKYKRSRSSLQA